MWMRLASPSLPVFPCDPLARVPSNCRPDSERRPVRQLSDAAIASQLVYSVASTWPPQFNFDRLFDITDGSSGFWQFIWLFVIGGKH
jgi:hypothetical protein